MPAALLPAQAAGALARAGFSRWATYRQAALAGMFTNTVFGIIKHVMGFRQFSLRALSSVTAEWSLVALAWNIKRMNVLRGV